MSGWESLFSSGASATPESTTPEISEEVPAIDSAEDAPTPVVHKILEAAASMALGASMKAIDLFVSHVRPAIKIDAILDPVFIERTFCAGRQVSAPCETLILLAANSVDTVHLGRAMHAEVVAGLQVTFDALAQRFPSEPHLKNEYNQAWWNLSAWTADDHILQVCLRAVEAAKRNDSSEFVGLARKAVGIDPAFNNPVLAAGMVRHFVDFGGDLDEVLAWHERALYYEPLHCGMLRFMRDHVDDTSSSVYEQLLVLAESLEVDDAGG